jgi:hypothetical protein
VTGRRGSIRRRRQPAGLRINLFCAARRVDAPERAGAASLPNIVERRGVHQEPRMARRAIVRLSLAPVRRLLVCSSWQLRAGDTTRAADRSVVLPRGPSNIQSPAGLSCSEVARLAGLDRAQRRRRTVRQEHGGSRRCAPRTRRHVAQRRALAAAAHSSGKNGPRACDAADGDRLARGTAGAGDRSQPGMRAAPPSPVALAGDPEPYSAAAGFPGGTECRAAARCAQPTRDGT